MKLVHLLNGIADYCLLTNAMWFSRFTRLTHGFINELNNSFHIANFICQWIVYSGFAYTFIYLTDRMNTKVLLHIFMWHPQFIQSKWTHSFRYWFWLTDQFPFHFQSNSIHIYLDFLIVTHTNTRWFRLWSEFIWSPSCAATVKYTHKMLLTLCRNKHWTNFVHANDLHYTRVQCALFDICGATEKNPIRLFPLFTSRNVVYVLFLAYMVIGWGSYSQMQWAELNAMRVKEIERNPNEGAQRKRQ